MRTYRFTSLHLCRADSSHIGARSREARVEPSAIRTLHTVRVQALAVSRDAIVARRE